MIDWERTKDTFFTWFFHFTLRPVGLIIEIFSVGAVFYLLKIDIAKNFGWMIGIGAFIWILLLVLRLKYFTEIPKGWDYRDWKDWQKIKSKAIGGGIWGNSFNKKYWITVLGICSWLVLLGLLSHDGDMFNAVPLTLMMSFFVFLYWGSYRDAKKKGKVKNDTKTMLKRLPLVFAPIGIFLIGVLAFLGVGIKNSGLGLLVMVVVIVGGMYVWYRYTKTKYPKSFLNNEIALKHAENVARYGKNRGGKVLLRLVAIVMIVCIAIVVFGI